MAKAAKTAVKPSVKPKARAVKPRAAATIDVPRYQAPTPPKALAPLRPAGGWLRLLARLIDAMILTLVGLLFGVLMAFLGVMVGAIDLSATEETITIFDILTWVLGIFLGLAYQGYFLSQHKATPGRMFLKLEVHHAETGEALSFWRAVGRSVADWLNILTLNLSYLMVFWRRDKRGLHDFIAKSRVVRRAEPLEIWRLMMAIILPIGWVFIVIIVIVIGVILAGAAAFEAEYDAETALPTIPLEAGPTE